MFQSHIGMHPRDGPALPGGLLAYPLVMEIWSLHEDVAAFQPVRGFNNDWDLSTAILKYLS